LELARRRIPFVKYGGLRFLEAAHVKDILSLLRWAQQPAPPAGGVSACAQLVAASGRPTVRRLQDADGRRPDPAAVRWRVLQAACRRARRLGGTGRCCSTLHDAAPALAGRFRRGARTGT
jgi:hypothetical protein